MDTTSTLETKWEDDRLKYAQIARNILSDFIAHEQGVRDWEPYSYDEATRGIEMAMVDAAHAALVHRLRQPLTLEAVLELGKRMHATLGEFVRDIDKVS